MFLVCSYPCHLAQRRAVNERRPVQHSPQGLTWEAWLMPAGRLLRGILTGSAQHQGPRRPPGTVWWLSRAWSLPVATPTLSRPPRGPLLEPL